MNLIDMTDAEILKIANPIWDGLVESSNKKDYGGFTKHFSKEMLFGANEVEIGKQWEDEHTDEVIERRQYGVDGDRHAQRDIEYPAPFKGRPRLGTRLFVRSNCRRFLQPLMRELGDWKDQTRVHAARLLRVCLV